ncbi:3-hydroxyacyl-CoA dehydrogenase [Cutaneotrichosporon oleaginosum]|uniref:L-gulonate 3-dehydrogenase n=1 Tax=Cutaneotrichosporon oleaginosum TaxID=879819 RepID=A0A0J0XXX5_9TREE|nr:3-hydroxyacyl-CoA dehydrogenase [Cutaneotrichosporon oleaginosum]KLT45898.1 3-hydroxyacyl-CoA dehydrogenase [Cutaneotrichosporon oleaginosum]TXT06598.1 hypothetical protein COLE_05929 [Cutaneotrichosporon oleaginosum]
MPTDPTSLRIAVLGAGQMGAGMAQVMVDAGHSVVCWDVPPEALATLDKRIRTTTHLNEAVVRVDLVLEAIAEDLAIKEEVYRRLSALNADCIVASNTSSLPAEKLAAALTPPERFAIAHFFNPAAIVPLVEIVPAPQTAPETLRKLKEVMERAGKLPVVLNRAVPGFVANRLQAALYREAYALAADGVASPEDIDLVVRAGLGSRWAAAGPMMVTDLGGMDIWKAVTGQLFPLLASDTVTPAAIEERVQRGDLGSKTGRGIYEHDPEEDQRIKDRMAAHFKLEFGQ